MAVETCFILNNSPSFAKVVVASVFAEADFTIPPNGFVTVFLQDGIKTLSAFQFGTGNLLNVFPISVSGSQTFEVLPPSGAFPVPAAYSGSPHVGGAAAPPFPGGTAP